MQMNFFRLLPAFTGPTVGSPIRLLRHPPRNNVHPLAARHSELVFANRDAAPIPNWFARPTCRSTVGRSAAIPPKASSSIRLRQDAPLPRVLAPVMVRTSGRPSYSPLSWPAEGVHTTACDKERPRGARRLVPTDQGLNDDDKRMWSLDRREGSLNAPPSDPGEAARRVRCLRIGESRICSSRRISALAINCPLNLDLPRFPTTAPIGPMRRAARSASRLPSRCSTTPTFGRRCVPAASLFGP